MRMMPMRFRSTPSVDATANQPLFQYMCAAVDTELLTKRDTGAGRTVLSSLATTVECDSCWMQLPRDAQALQIRYAEGSGGGPCRHLLNRKLGPTWKFANAASYWASSHIQLSVAVEADTKLLVVKLSRAV